MASRPHEYETFKDAETGITVDLRVFWGRDTDLQIVRNEIMMTVASLMARLDARRSAGS